MAASRPRRLMAVSILIIALAVMLAGIGRLTLWKPSPYITVTSTAAAAPLVITAENVLESTGESVSLTAKGDPDASVFLAVGLTTDVQEFARSADHVLLEGFKSATKFKQSTIKASKNSANSEKKLPGGLQALAAPLQPPVSDLTKLDIWESTAVGKGSAKLTWTLSDNRWSAVTFTDGSAPAPVLQLRWEREPSLVSWWIMAIMGGFTALGMGIYQVLNYISEFRSRISHQQTAQRQHTRQLAAQVTGVAAKTTGSDLPSRRALRRAEEAKSGENKRSLRGGLRFSHRTQEPTGQRGEPKQSDLEKGSLTETGLTESGLTEEGGQP